jgi:predicted phage terminase large subunit-like protein
MPSARRQPNPAPEDAASLLDRVVDLPAEARRQLIGELSQAEVEQVLFDWRAWARPDQLEPSGEEWTTWAIITGRGWGKTRTAAEWVRANIHRYGRWAFVARTATDCRDVMVEGESGILSVFPPHQSPEYQASRRRLVFANGAIATLFSANEPDQLRGPQHEAAWSDEVASWPYVEAWDNLQLGLRLGPCPRQVVTTTPKPLRILRELLAVEGADVVATRGTTYDNRSNLAPAFFEQIIRRYEGTTLGRQELCGELLDDVPGALWKRALLDAHRVQPDAVPQMQRIVVGIDPATTHGEDADLTGMAVAGLGTDGEFYVLEIGGYRMSPLGWAKRAIMLFEDYEADRIVAESNQGGELVEANIRTVRANAPIKLIHAKRGKVPRAEPVAALYEQGRVHHVGLFEDAEDQMCTFPVATELDDMVDALVHAITELEQDGVAPAGMTGPPPVSIREQIARRRAGLGMSWA